VRLSNYLERESEVVIDPFVFECLCGSGYRRGAKVRKRAFLTTD
jgi:hypothetical protein